MILVDIVSMDQLIDLYSLRTLSSGANYYQIYDSVGMHSTPYSVYVSTERAPPSRADNADKPLRLQQIIFASSTRQTNEELTLLKESEQ